MTCNLIIVDVWQRFMYNSAAVFDWLQSDIGA